MITFSDSLGNNNGMAEPGEDLFFTFPLINRLTRPTTTQRKIDDYSASYGDIASWDTFPRHSIIAFPRHGLRYNPANPIRVTSDNGAAKTTIPASRRTTMTVVFRKISTAWSHPPCPTGWTITTTGSATAAWKTAATTVIDTGNYAKRRRILARPRMQHSLVRDIAVGAGSQQLSYKQRYTTETAVQWWRPRDQYRRRCLHRHTRYRWWFLCSWRLRHHSITSQATGNPLH